MSRFTDTTVIITGATGAIGASMVHGFAAEGANVVVAARDPDQTAALAAAVGAHAFPVGLDIADEDSWAAAITSVEAHFGPVDVLVNNAANLKVGTVETITVADWRAVIDTNLTGAFLGIRAVAPSMRKAGGGSIININSIAGLAAAPGLVAYSSSKWGLRGLTRAAAVELARDNIRVNALHPGIVETPLAYDPATGDELVPVTTFAIPRRADPDEVTAYVLFIASPAAAFSTGSEFLADGGFMLGPVPAA